MSISDPDEEIATTSTNHDFICYARADEDFVLKLARNLKDRGVPVWLDQWNIPPGVDWNRAIDNALYTCDQFLIVLSPTAVDSREVHGELRTALDEGKHIVPVLYQDCQIPRQLRTIQYVDYRSRGPDDEAALTEMLSVLGAPLTPTPDKDEEQPIPSHPDPPVVNPRPTSRQRPARWAYVGIGGLVLLGLVVLVAMVAVWIFDDALAGPNTSTQTPTVVRSVEPAPSPTIVTPTPTFTPAPTPTPTPMPEAQLVGWGPGFYKREAGICINDCVEFIPWVRLEEEIQRELLPQISDVPPGSHVALDDLNGQRDLIVQVLDPAGREIAHIWFGPDPHDWSFDGLVRIGKPKAPPLVIWGTFQRYSDGTYRR